MTSETSPRNPWTRVLEALEMRGAQDPDHARAILESLRYHPGLGPQAFEVLRRHIEAIGASDRSAAKIDTPADFLSRPDMPRPFRRLTADREVPPRFPSDMCLPDLVGSRNDHQFLHKAAAALAFGAQAAPMRVAVLFSPAVPSDIDAILTGIARQTTSARIDLHVFAADPSQTLPGLSATQGFTVETLPFGILEPRGREHVEQLSQSADLLVFLSGRIDLDSGAIDRAVHLGRISDAAVQPLEKISADLPNNTPYALQSGPHPFSGRYPFRDVHGLNLVISRSLYRKIGGLNGDFREVFHAGRELAFRCHNAGAYFSPLFVADLQPRAADSRQEADSKLFVELCPNSWDRKRDGRFLVPKVSVYIPAYNAGAYIERAVASVLEQDVSDLEVCILNDGSRDDTLKVLEKAFGNESRVRWESRPNGGIGFASNEAIAMCRGIYIGQLDSDDCLKPGAIRRMTDYLDANPGLACCYGSCERIDRNGNRLEDEYRWPEFSREKMLITSIVHHFRMFRKSAWERTARFRTDIRNAVDYDIFLKLMDTGRFHHIDEILYQRRWHGENTSHVNEGFQTENTYRVQREALKRMGMSDFWDVWLPEGPGHPRTVSYKPVRSRPRIVFWPHYAQSNPYQSLLYRQAMRSHEVLAGPIESAIGLLEKPLHRYDVTFHLHWLAFLFLGAEDEAEARLRVRKFLLNIQRFKEYGGRFVWTIHNTISHDSRFEALEAHLSSELAGLADVLHVHSAASIPEIEKTFALPPEKIRISRHGHYLGAYPDYVSPQTARECLHVDPDEDLILFVGQLRAYKGIEDLLRAFREILETRPKARLMIAGLMRHDVLADLSPELTEFERSRITVTGRFLDDSELQVFFRAADMAVFPYRKILTSGSLLLALSFGVPAIVPRVGMTAEILEGTDAGLLYDAGDDDALLAAIRDMLERKDRGELDAMRAGALARARAQEWPDIAESILSQRPPSGAAASEPAAAPARLSSGSG